MNSIPSSNSTRLLFNSFRSSTKLIAPIVASAVFAALACSMAAGQAASQGCTISQDGGTVQVHAANGVIELQMIAPDILRVDAEPQGKASPRTLVIDPSLETSGGRHMNVSPAANSVRFASPQLQAAFTCSPKPSLVVRDGSGKKLVEQQDPLGEARGRRADFSYATGENLYGMSGLSWRENGEGLLRNNGARVAAGAQGEIGGPWFFTTHFGVLIDSDGGTFDARDGWVEFSGGSREDVEYFVVAGEPMQTMSGLAKLTGKPPLPPKWTLGFLNSQWGSTEAELKQIAATYRAKHIPLDAFILDFDWKAWGEDNYGEWRWNSTSGRGNFSPDKFPDGASGVFAKEMREQGIKLAGILKPRILLYKKGSTTEMHEAAAYAETHHLWYPGEPPQIDYFTQRPARDLDFSKPETRSWYWQHLEPAFDAGMVGWWNDEADITAGERGQDFYFDNFQFLNMGKAIYDGQRSHSDLRVWSLNRNGYVGAPRYGYAEWSGDIQTGFQTMRHQRMRMLATLDLGQPHWGMDGGGFFGHPTDENYARWIEFASFVPIDRVHGDLTEHRQPWLFGPVAEAAATRAIRLRYELLPYIYSFERAATESSIGVVRPLFWQFPNDPKVANDGDAWMFGDALLVSPVMAAGETSHDVYLPAGEWFDYFRGTRFTGGKSITVPVDAKTWKDIPLFVRDGSIVATQQPEDYVDQRPAEEIILDVFPAAHRADFVYYEDDGNTYGYERGAYYRQAIHAVKTQDRVVVDLDKPTGSFHPAVRTYIVRIHGIAAHAVRQGHIPMKRSQAAGEGAALAKGEWSTGSDRFGPITIVRIAAGEADALAVQ